MVLAASFFQRSTLSVARELLGCVLCRHIGRRILRGTITETEAYCGPHDLASHASRGRTPRTAVMFGPPGYAYVYLIYGMHWCLNIVTERAGYPAAVLIRAALVPNVPADHTNGPGKLCRFFKIDKTFNGKLLSRSTGLWIERPAAFRPFTSDRTPRIGVDFAGPYRRKRWRFVISPLPHQPRGRRRRLTT